MGKGDNPKIFNFRFWQICQFYSIKIKKLSSFKSNENIHKREDGSYYVVSANKASSVTL